MTATFTPDRWPAYCLICADLVPAGDGEMAAHCEARHPMDRLRPLLKRTALALDDRRALARAHWEGLREDGGKPFSTAAAFTTLWRWTGRIDRCHKAATCTPMAVSPAYLRGEAPA